MRSDTREYIMRICGRRPSSEDRIVKILGRQTGNVLRTTDRRKPASGDSLPIAATTPIYLLGEDSGADDHKRHSARTYLKTCSYEHMQTFTLIYVGAA